MASTKNVKKINKVNPSRITFAALSKEASTFNHGPQNWLKLAKMLLEAYSFSSVLTALGYNCWNNLCDDLLLTDKARHNLVEAYMYSQQVFSRQSLAGMANGKTAPRWDHRTALKAKRLEGRVRKSSAAYKDLQAFLNKVAKDGGTIREINEIFSNNGIDLGTGFPKSVKNMTASQLRKKVISLQNQVAKLIEQNARLRKERDFFRNCSKELLPFAVAAYKSGGIVESYDKSFLTYKS